MPLLIVMLYDKRTKQGNNISSGAKEQNGEVGGEGRGWHGAVRT